MIRYSEIFRSIQGEGKYTGAPSVWLRFFLCNLNCDGFGQQDPTNRDTYELPYKDIDLINVTDITELPVFSKGCDSSYSWSAKYKHLAKNESVEEVYNKITSLLPHGKFNDVVNTRDYHMCFTGGEPMLSQQAMLSFLQHCLLNNNLPRRVTVETNGTQPIIPALYTFIKAHYNRPTTEWFWSYSPKLFSVSGEPNKRAIKPLIVLDYFEASQSGQIKPVVGTTDAQWIELDEIINRVLYPVIAKFNPPVYIMPVGATEEGQDEVAAAVCEKALDRGYSFSGRLHTYVYGNKIGT